MDLKIRTIKHESSTHTNTQLFNVENVPDVEKSRVTENYVNQVATSRRFKVDYDIFNTRSHRSFACSTTIWIIFKYRFTSSEC